MIFWRSSDIYFFVEPQEEEEKAILCCYHAMNTYYYKYTVDGINVFAVSILLNMQIEVSRLIHSPLYSRLRHGSCI